MINVLLNILCFLIFYRRVQVVCNQQFQFLCSINLYKLQLGTMLTRGLHYSKPSPQVMSNNPLRAKEAKVE